MEDTPEILQGVQAQVQGVQVQNNFCPLLSQLLKNAEKNALKLPQQRRHEAVMKKFATSFFFVMSLLLVLMTWLTALRTLE